MLDDVRLADNDYLRREQEYDILKFILLFHDPILV
jgi:hypothetical protein